MPWKDFWAKKPTEVGLLSSLIITAYDEMVSRITVSELLFWFSDKSFGIKSKHGVVKKLLLWWEFLVHMRFIWDLTRLQSLWAHFLIMALEWSRNTVSSRKCYCGENILSICCAYEPWLVSSLYTLCIISSGGGAYTLGRQNSGNCWHLFTIDNYIDGLKIPDQTLEVSFVL